MRARIWHPLTAVIALGVALRAAAMAGYRPAYAVYSDTTAYVYSALEPTLASPTPTRPAGYSAFLELLHWVWASMTLVVSVQHVLGLGTAVLLYLAMRRLGAPRVLGVVAAATVALVPDFVFFEHALLTESLFLFFLTAALYATVRGVDESTLGDPGRRWLAWLAAVGALLAAAAMVRALGEMLIPLIALAVAAGVSGSAIRRATAAAAVALPSVALILAYSVAMSAGGGYFGLADGEGWAMYTRMAPVADCNRFTPPAGTEGLCEANEPVARGGPDFYAWHPDSPGRRLFGGSPQNDELVGAFGREALLHQPLDYLKLVATDLWRYIDPDAGPDREGNGNLLSLYRFDGETSQVVTEGPVADFYGPHRFVITDLGRSLGDIQQVVRIHGALVLVALAMALAGSLVARARLRFGIVLLGATGFALLLFPVAVSTYNGRYGLMAYPSLVCAGLLGGWVVWERVAQRGDRRVAGFVGGRETSGIETPTP